jgi:hypothetical protein
MENQNKNNFCTGIGTPLGGLEVIYRNGKLFLALAGKEIWVSDGLSDAVHTNSSSYGDEYKFVRAKQLFGDDELGIAPLVPFSPREWFDLIDEGKAPMPIQKDSNKSVWRLKDVMDFLVEYLPEYISE